MPNKEMARAGGAGGGAVVGASAGGGAKTATCGNKPPHVKSEAGVMSPTGCTAVAVAAGSVPVSPGAPGGGMSADELLGSLTTQQQQRTSARVIKKLRLDSALDEPGIERDKRDTLDAMDKVDDKEGDGKLPGGGKQRMPKALWSSDEKSLFFEALNEYGKDFDAITAYICAKMKRRGPHASGPNAKTKSQVSHFYYRTWHKLSKYTTFGDNVKKVVQELYALINYGEMRRKLSAFAVNAKTCSRLQELITRGTVLLRVRGRSLRLRTPQCRTLRALNRITECAAGLRVPTRVTVMLRARSAAAWARVQSAAHNPRVALTAPLRTQLRTMLHALQARWEVSRARRDQEYGGCRTALHVGPREGLDLNSPTITLSETPHVHKICFFSYLERMRAGHREDNASVKIRTPKRQRKDSGTEKEKETVGVVEKRARTSETEQENKSMLDIEEEAIDGIELMATLSTEKEQEITKPSEPVDLKLEDLKSEDQSDEIKTEDGTDNEEVKDEEIKEDETEREKDSFSELEDEEKFSETDDADRPTRPNAQTFRNLKVKFRVRTKKNSDAREYSVVCEGEEKTPGQGAGAPPPPPPPHLLAARAQMARGWSAHDAGQLTLGDLYLMFGSESRLELDYWWCPPTSPLSPPLATPLAPSLPAGQPDRHASDARAAVAALAVDTGVAADVISAEKCLDEREGSDTELMSPRQHYSHDSNDTLSGDEKKRPEEAGPVLRLADKLRNRADSPSHPHHQQLLTLTSRLRRLLALAAGGGASPAATGGGGLARGGGGCACGHICPQRQKRSFTSNEALRQPACGYSQPVSIAPKPGVQASNELCLEEVPRWRRGRPPGQARDRVVVQRLLPLLPKPHTLSAPGLIPVKMVSTCAPATTPVAILPKPAVITTVAPSRSYVYVLSTEGVASSSSPTQLTSDNDLKRVMKEEAFGEETAAEEQEQRSGDLEPKQESRDFTAFLSSESLSMPCMSPSRLLRDADGAWLERDVHDFSLSSFLGHLEGTAPQPAAEVVDTQLQCMMQESSIDYMAKFADLAAEVASDRDVTKN